MKNSSLLIAHQVIASNNGIPKKAIELMKRLQGQGIKIIEFDIRQTKDRGFVAFHDSKFPGFSGRIRTYSFNELKKGSQQKNFTFLTLEEVLSIVPSGFEINIHLKDAEVDIERLVGVLQRFNVCNRVIISTNYPKTLARLAQSEIKKRWLVTSISYRRSPIHLWYAIMPIKTALACQATGIASHYQLVTLALIKKAHQRNLTVAAWTVNKEKDIKRLSRWGVDWIISDYPLGK
jgi:glycerophosphoryl diester phosphodiesterase